MSNTSALNSNVEVLNVPDIVDMCNADTVQSEYLYCWGSPVNFIVQLLVLSVVISLSFDLIT